MQQSFKELRCVFPFDGDSEAVWESMLLLKNGKTGLIVKELTYLSLTNDMFPLVVFQEYLRVEEQIETSDCINT